MTGDALDAFAAKWDAPSAEQAMAKAAAHTTKGFAQYPPIDPGALAGRFGASVSVMRDSPRDGHDELIDHGQLTVVQGRWHIRVPRETTLERRRFSVAHEIGHVLLFSAVADDQRLVKQLRSGALFKRVERLCNIGAASLLMPSDSFGAALEGLLPPRRETVEGLATRFQVSLEAAARRISEVRPEWSVMFWSHSTSHPRGPAWRTSHQHQRDGDTFLPSGLSSSRLQPDIVERAANEGSATAENVLARLPGISRMMDVSAWHVARSRLELVSVEDGRSSRPSERVFVFYRNVTADV